MPTKKRKPRDPKLLYFSVRAPQPRMVTDTIRDEVKLAVWAGADRKILAVQTNLSIHTINRIMQGDYD